MAATISVKATVENPRGSVGQTLSCKTSGAAPPQFCRLEFALGRSLGSPRHSPEVRVIPLCPKDFQQLLLPKS